MKTLGFFSSEKTDSDDIFIWSSTNCFLDFEEEKNTVLQLKIINNLDPKNIKITDCSLTQPKTITPKIKKINNNLFVINIPLLKTRKIRIESPKFVVSPKSKDPRDLGLMINEIKVGNETLNLCEFSYFEQEDILSFQSNDSISNNLLYKEDILEKDIFINDKVTVILTCHGDRYLMAEEAYRSVKKAGFKNIIILLSDVTKKYHEWALSKNEKIVISKNSLNNNQCWIKSLKESETLWSMILHDDDKYNENILEEISYIKESASFGLLNGSVISEKNKKLSSNSSQIHISKRGFYNTALLKEAIDNHQLTISTIQGIFKTKNFIKALEEWEKTYGSQKKYYIKENFVVGNDLYLWTHHLNLSSNKFYFSPKENIYCVAHKKSSTIEDSKSLNVFPNIYKEIKSFEILQKKSTCIFIHLHAIDAKTIKTLDNFCAYKTSKNNLEIIILSCYDLIIPNRYKKYFKLVKINDDYQNCKINVGPCFGRSDMIGFWSFIKMIEIAKEKKIDYFFCYEWDCMIGEDYWFDKIWHECLSWDEPTLVGSPVLKLSHKANHDFFYRIHDYKNHYSKSCEVEMVIENNGEFAFFVNGALAFYKTEDLYQIYKKEINLPSLNRSLNYFAPGPWDLDLGVKMLKKYKLETFNKIKWLNSAYSGCTDTYYSQNQRLSMLEEKKKSVIHQYKY